MSPAADRAPNKAGPWLALALPALTWFVFEVGLAGALRWSCRSVGAGLGVGWGCVSLVVCALSVIVAWRRSRPLSRPVDDRSASPAWLFRVALCAAGVFALAILFQTVATLIVPSCAR